MPHPHTVLFAIPELDSSGPDRVFHELLKGIDRAKYEPHLAVIHAGGRYFSLLPDDVEQHVVGGGRYPVWKFARLVDRLRPDLIFTTLRMNSTAAAAQFLQRHKPPIVARQANAIRLDFTELKKKTLIKHRLAEFISNRLLRVPQVLVSQSSDMATELAGHTAPHQRVAVIGNPVSVEEIEDSLQREILADRPTPAGRPFLVAVGRLASQKGFDLLLPAFAKFRSEFPDAGLKIFGEGPDRPALETMSRELSVETAVKFSGTTERIFSEVAAADIFVSSSRYEGFSNAILEAMALARPVVATNCEGATKQMILDGQTGILVDAFDEDALAHGLVRMMAEDRQLLGRNARQHVQEHYSRQNIVAAYQQCFESALAAEPTVASHEN